MSLLKFLEPPVTIKESSPGKELCFCCGQEMVKICDWPLDQGNCDRKLCKDHATEVGPDRDYCPEHFEIIINQGKLKGT